MFWKVRLEERQESLQGEKAAAAGRFVLHRHEDEGGTHLDLRLEQPGGYLLGWRIDSESLDGEPWATEKLPHPLSWLDRDGPAIRQDSGTFGWLREEREERRLLLQGEHGERELTFEREAAVQPRAARAVAEALRKADVDGDQLGALLMDGIQARERAMERFCGLGRELDANTFDEGLWRKTLRGLSLDEIQTYLRSYEVRFDQKYPPQRISLPTALSGEECEARTEGALAILRDGS